MQSAIKPMRNIAPEEIGDGGSVIDRSSLVQDRLATDMEIGR